MQTLNKQYLRAQFLARRNALSPAETEALNRGLLIQAQTIRWPEQGIVHTFLPILSKKEPDTFRIIDWLLQAYPTIRIAVPRVADAQRGILVHHLYGGQDTLEKNKWGIPEPTGGMRVHPSDIDTILVPLLAEDLVGHRVGYGAGFYDRFLASCPPDALKIGLSLFEPVARIADVQPTDVPLDGCITPSQVYWFGGPRQ